MQEFDIERTINTDKRLEELTGIAFIQDTFEKGKNPEYAKNLYNIIYANFQRKLTQLLDSAIDKAIKSRCRSLGILASGLASSTERAFYMKRQDYLRLINKEHQKNINQHLGLSKEKNLSLGLEFCKKIIQYKQIIPSFVPAYLQLYAL